MGLSDWLHRNDRPGAPESLEAQVIAALRTVFDPEIPVNIYDLGLVYGLEVAPDGDVRIRMTLTAPGCPVAQTFPATVADTVRQVAGVREVDLELVWEPPWSQELMSEAARLNGGCCEMDDWQNVAPASEFPPGACHTVDLAGVPVAVFNIGGRYYAIEDCCSHEAETLSYGTVEGLEITCPRHLARFSLVTGAALSPPAYEPVATFPVRVERGMVQVRDDRFD